MEEKNEKTLSLSELWLAFRANVVWVLLIIIACVATGAGYLVFFKKTTYTATCGMSVYVQSLYEDSNSDKTAAEYNKFQYAALLAPQFEKIMKSSEIIESVAKDDASTGEKGVKVNPKSITFTYGKSSAEKSNLFDISYTYKAHGGNESVIASKVADLLNKYVTKSINIINTQTVDVTKDGVTTQVKKYGYCCNVLYVISRANTDNVKVSKGTTTTLLLSFVIGIVLAAIYVITVYFVDDRISTREDAERISGMSVLAVIDISANAQENSSYTETNKEGA